MRWPNGAECPHCGVPGPHYELKGKAHRAGLWKCRACRQQFSVTVGTAFASSKIPLHKWIYAAAVVARSPGVTTQELQRIVGVTYKSAWYLRRRLRQAIALDQDAVVDTVLAAPPPPEPEPEPAPAELEPRELARA